MQLRPEMSMTVRAPVNGQTLSGHSLHVDDLTSSSSAGPLRIAVPRACFLASLCFAKHPKEYDWLCRLAKRRLQGTAADEQQSAFACTSAGGPVPT